MLSRLACALAAKSWSSYAIMSVRKQAGFGTLLGLLRALCGVMLPLNIHIFLLFVGFPDGRRRFIKRLLLLPTYLNSPYRKLTFSELLATKFEGCLHGD